jgi:mono/diheme cytochrome c family protein
VPLAVAFAVSCASAPPPERPAECPAPGPRAAPASALGAAGDPQRGAVVFESVCADCHSSRAEDRTPDAAAGAPRLDCPEWLAATSNAYLYDAINRGPGQWGHGELPPLGERLTSEQIADLVAYLRRLGERG